MQTAIVILNYNGLDYLKKFLPKVLKFSESASVVVIDNASTDASVDFLKEQNDIQLVELSKNYGFAGGYNQGLKHLTAQHYILLNSDVLVIKGWIDPMIELLNSREDIAIVQPKILSYHEPEKFEHAGAAGGFVDFLGYPFCRGRVLGHTEKDDGQYDDQVEIFWATGACFAIKADVFHDLGGFDNAFFAHMEEIDLCWRAQQKGHKCMYTSKSHVFHIGGGTLEMNNPFKVYLNFRNNLCMLLKNAGFTTLLWLLPLRMLLDGLAALKFISEGKFKAALKVLHAHLSFYYLFPSMFKKRVVSSKKVRLFEKSIILNFYLRNNKTFRALK